MSINTKADLLDLRRQLADVEQERVAARERRPTTTLAFRRALDRRLDPHMAGTDGWTDLHYAAILNLPRLAAALLRRGAAVDARLHDPLAADDWPVSMLADFGFVYDHCPNHTPLHLACMADAAPTVRILLSHGADIHAIVPSVSRWTPLHIAVRYDAAKTAELLLAQGANVERTDEYGGTGLHVASTYNSVACAEILLKHGANPNAPTSVDDVTPLHGAAMANSPGVASRLIDYGANVNALSRVDNISPLDYAVCYQSRSTADLIRRRGGKLTIARQIGEIASFETDVFGIPAKLRMFAPNQWVRNIPGRPPGEPLQTRESSRRET